MIDYQFVNTQTFKNLSEYLKGWSRVNFELLLVYCLVKYFNFNEILEIGFKQGQTFGALIEATTHGSLTAVDIEFDMSLYDKFYKDSEYIKNKEIKFLKMSSVDFTDSAKKYDFINVDGDHTMPVVLSDLINATKLIKNTGILMFDDYTLPDVDFAINELLKLNTDFVPFLIDEQSVYFHHVSHDASNFLDFELKKIFEAFCDISYINYKNFHVSKISCLPAVTYHNDVFSLICQKYNL